MNYCVIHMREHGADFPKMYRSGAVVYIHTFLFFELC